MIKSIFTYCFMSMMCHFETCYVCIISVAEENLAEAEIPEKGRFDHPYIEFLFFGEDTAGDFIPIKQLREKYDQPRYEASGDEDDDDGSTDS